MFYFRKSDDYLYMYRVSYMWYAPIGFLMTFIFGLGLSYCLNRIYKEPKVGLDTNLFFPLIGERIRHRNREISSSSENVVSKNATAHKKYIFNVNSANDVVEPSDDTNTTKL